MREIRLEEKTTQMMEFKQTRWKPSRKKDNRDKYHVTQ